MENDKIQDTMGNRKTIYISANDAAIYNKAEAYAKEQNLSLSSVIAKALEIFIDTNTKENRYKNFDLLNISGTENLDEMLFPSFDRKNIYAKEIFYMKDEDMIVRLLKEKSGMVYLQTYFDTEKIENSKSQFSHYVVLRRFGEALIHEPKEQFCSSNALSHIKELSNAVKERIKKEASTIALNSTD